MSTSSLSATDIDRLVQGALKARDTSYSPYSNFRVGAALLAKEGQVFSGCNVENVSFGGTICAERTAFVKAVSEGHRTFRAIAVATDKSKCATPCGICRQFMREFGDQLEVFLVDPSGEYTLTSIKELLPAAFAPGDI